MNKIFLFTLIMVFSFTGTSRAGMYLGGRTGMMMLDLEDVDDIIPVGGLFGYSITPLISIEGELNYGIAGGDWDPMPGVSADFNIWTVAGYGAFRYPLGDAAYLKGKIGILRETVDAETTIDIFGYTYTFDLSATDTGLSFGGGGGYKISDNMMIEAEFTIIEQDVNFLSIGLNVGF